MDQQCLPFERVTFLMPFKAISAAVFRGIVVLLVPVFLQGCFASDVPAITASSAEDVGPQLQYWIYSGNQLGDDGLRSKTDMARFVRQAGVDYQLQLVSANDMNAALPYANGMYLRRLGMRSETSIFLVQFDLARFELIPGMTPDKMGFGFMFYPVAVDAQQYGTVGTVACDDEAVLAIAEKRGVNLNCMKFDGAMLPRVANRPSEVQLWAFFQDIMHDGLLQWEDTNGIGALDWIE